MGGAAEIEMMIGFGTLAQLMKNFIQTLPEPPAAWSTTQPRTTKMPYGVQTNPAHPAVACRGARGGASLPNKGASHVVIVVVVLLSVVADVRAGGLQRIGEFYQHFST